MRWDLLFADLEGLAEDEAIRERDALVTELRDEQWEQMSWADLAGGHVEIEVLGVGRIAGHVRLINATLVHLSTSRANHVVARGAVLALHSHERRADPAGAVAARLGWAQLMRRIRSDGESVRLVGMNQQIWRGRVDIVGKDFVQVTTEAGRQVVVTYSGLAVVLIDT